MSDPVFAAAGARGRARPLLVSSHEPFDILAFVCLRAGTVGMTGMTRDFACAVAASTLTDSPVDSSGLDISVTA